MPNTKSKMAFKFTVEDLQVKLYHWTFTFKQALDLEDARKRWANFLNKGSGRHRSLIDCFPTVSGLRVFEMHPGQRRDGEGGFLSHGLHVHAVVNERLPVDVVRNLWNQEHIGGGRVHVAYHENRRALYLGKYLSKERPECMQGFRLWAAFGHCKAHRVKDIVVQSDWTEAYYFLATAIRGFQALPWEERIKIVTRFRVGDNIIDALEAQGSYEAPKEDGKHEHRDETDKAFTY